jgi:hypothetical protein
MSPTELLQRLSTRGVNLLSADGRLRVDAPPGTLTDLERQLLAAHKTELLALLVENWDPVEASALVSLALAIWPLPAGAGSHTWSRLNPLADQIDVAFLRRDMSSLRAAVREFLEVATTIEHLTHVWDSAS